jgi:competence protein ComFC
LKYCLFCQQKLVAWTSWQMFLLLDKTTRNVCQACEQKLKKIPGVVCDTCGRSMANLPPDHHHKCHDCLRWEEQPEMKGVLTKSRSIYLYNDFMKEILARYKFRGDHELVYAFQAVFQATFKQHYSSSSMIVPIPLSDERLYERGFNQSEALAKLLNEPVSSLLLRQHLEKQSKKSREQRIHSKNIFTLNISADVKGRDILLIDDIYTTGTTLRHAAAVFLTKEAASVSALTLIRG